MRIGIVGAGFAGLSSAKVLKSFGHDVTVFEKEADVGGVWSASRRYPGLTTQNVRDTYYLSDFPYPKDYPEWPTGEQVQRYLVSYASHFHLDNLIKLNTRVDLAEQDPASNKWTVKSTHVKTGAQETQMFDFLIVANGIFSTPMIPRYEGDEAFMQAGGRVLHTSQLTNLADADGKHVVVIGYGKSSCDVANSVCKTAASSTVVVRNLIWKVPRMLFNVLNYKYLLLTRLGEGLFKYIEVRGFEKFLHGVGKPIRNSMLSQLQWVVTKQCKLKELDLVPPRPFETIARSTVSLTTQGFYENVAAGKIKVKKEAEIKKLEVRPEGKFAVLSTGETIPADLVVCGTGWTQTVPFFTAEFSKKFLDHEGNFRLYRSMLPVGVKGLAFNGYNSSFFSQLNCEIGALWIADLLHGGVKLPSTQEQLHMVDKRLAWMKERTDGKHSKGTNIIPFSLHHIDELMRDMNLQLNVLTRFKQWLLPGNPGDYKVVTTKLLKRYNKI